MHIRSIPTRIVRENDDLPAFLVEHIDVLHEKDIVVVTSKIVALCEGRTALLEQKEQLIRAESSRSWETKYVWLTVKDGMFMASAGIDESNADGKLVLLPHDSFAAAHAIRYALREKFGVQNLGVVVTDSHTAPLRAGVTGVALGYAGFVGLKDYRGMNDIFGRALHFSSVNVADSLAAAAVLLMGEGDERRPLAVIEDAPVEFVDEIRRDELLIDPEDDMYFPLVRDVPGKPSS